MAGDQATNRMNLDLDLDLNLSLFPSVSPHPEDDPASGSLLISLEDWIGRRTNRRRIEANRRRHHRRSIQRQQVPMPISVEPIKTCDSNASHVHNNEDASKKKKKEEDDEKDNEGSFFDCNICLDMSRNPVVTCCGHLFCWTCLYQWIHLHSVTKECPVCKGEVSTKTLTPIYGRGITNHELDEDESLEIPARPQAHRVESWRQSIQRETYTLPVEEMILRLRDRYDFTTREETNDNNNVILDRILALRRMREVVDLTEDNTAADSRRLARLMLRRQQALRVATVPQAPLALVTSSSAEHHHPLSGEDRDSVSSIAAVIQSGSQMVDNVVEIDSTVSPSASSSRVEDIDSGDNRPLTRRRLD